MPEPSTHVRVRLVFDPVLWGHKDVGDNSQFWKPATILRTYTRTTGARDEELADVQFHHDDRISRGHFTEAMRDG